MYNSRVQTPSFASGFATAQIQNLQVKTMLIRKSRNLLRAILIGALLIALPYSQFAQDQTQSAEKPPVKKSKPSADSCDGALDIVPGKSMTFTRKRRSTKSDTKSETKSNTKSEAKPETKSEARPETKPEGPNHQII
jgi:cytoskeletal protein RodZ